MAPLPLIDDAGSGDEVPRCGGLPLREVALEGRMEGLVGWVTLTQVFANEGEGPVEATYVFPLPDRAAVTGFLLEVGGRRERGVLRERAEARRRFEEATAEGQRAALAEEERPDVFTVTVGNVMPGDRVTIVLSLVVPLGCADGEAWFRFPLVVAPRYAPGAALPGGQLGRGVARDTDRTPDASRVSPPSLGPGEPAAVRFSCSLWLDPRDLGARDLRASLPMEAEPLGEGGLVLRLAPGQRMDRDLVVRFAVGGEAVQSALLLAPGEGGGGWFALTLVPPAGGEGDARPRDVVVVLDRSGSMQGWKMTVARRASAALVRALRPADRFAVLVFDDAIVEPPLVRDGALAPATERNVALAERYLDRVEINGGTEMAEPLRRAIEAAASGGEGRRGLVVVITDGQVANEDDLLARLGEGLSRVTLCAIGIDTAVAAGFLGRLSSMGGGWFEQVESEARLEQAVARALARLRAPLADDLRIEMEGLVEGSVTPARLPALYAGMPLVALGRYTGEGPAEARVVGHAAGGAPLRLRAAARPAEPSAIRALWARGRIRDLEDSLASGAPLDPRRTGGASYEEAIVAASLEGGVLSRLTAFVAVDERRVNPGGEASPAVQPVERPAGWAAPRSPASSGLGAGLGGLGMRSHQTRSGTIRGNLRYMSPEQAMGKQEDERSAVFLLGLVLHELLCGTPYARGSDTMQTLMFLVSNKPTQILTDPALAALDAVLVRSLQPDPAQRFADAAGMLAALRSCAPSPEAARPALAALVQQQGAAELARWQALVERATRGEGAPRLGTYLGVEQLDTTSEAEIWLGARPEAPGGFRAVELHIAHPHMLDDEAAEILLRTARVVHPSVVELIEVVEAGDDLGLVFAAEPVVPLPELLRRCALPAEVALLIGCDLASIVASLGETRDASGRLRPMLMRELYPSLVRLTPDGGCRLLLSVAASTPELIPPFRSLPAAPAAASPPRPPPPRPAAGAPPPGVTASSASASSASASAPGSSSPASPGDPGGGPSSGVGAWLRRVFRRG